jgi:hypothetical protein
MFVRMHYTIRNREIVYAANEYIDCVTFHGVSPTAFDYGSLVEMLNTNTTCIYCTKGFV